MAYVYGFIVIAILIILFFISKTYTIQLFLRKSRIKKAFLNDFKKSTKGKFISEAYFAPSHKIISNHEFNSLTNKQKMNFSKCYNVITFKTSDAQWELFFHLIKEGISFTEILNIRVFPLRETIKSEGNVEKTYGRVNIFTNNHYLTKLLETRVTDSINWLMRYDGDMLLISQNNIHFKAFIGVKKMSLNRSMDMVKSMNGIKSGIYKKDVLEY